MTPFGQHQMEGLQVFCLVVVAIFIGNKIIYELNEFTLLPFIAINISVELKVLVGQNHMSTLRPSQPAKQVLPTVRQYEDYFLSKLICETCG
jgi:hypothetical protein